MIREDPRDQDKQRAEGSCRVLPIDHLVYAVPVLAAGVEHLLSLLGVRAAVGGRHPVWGTRNALIALGDETYLEVLGPDPDGPPPAGRRPFGIDDIEAPCLATWAVKGSDLQSVVDTARQCGVDLGGVLEGTRCGADGVRLSWKLTDPMMPRAAGIVPFFIDWGDTPHPAGSATQGCSLIGVRAEHPDPRGIAPLLAGLGFDLRVDPGPAAALIATIETPLGTVELR